MPRFLSHSSRRLIAALAMATTLALPALTIIGGQAPANVAGKSTTTVSPFNTKWH